MYILALLAIAALTVTKSETVISLLDKRVKKDPKIWETWAPAAMRAKEIWEKEGIRVPSFTLAAADSEACGGDDEGFFTIGCAQMESRRIIFIVHDPPPSCTKTAVIVHEIGHLLGVPDIPGDPLMSSECLDTSAEAERPSPIVIKLAKVGLWRSR